MRWPVVDSSGHRVATYDIFKLVSGIDRLAEINGLDGEDLRADAALSCRREIWDYLADAARGILDTREHRGGTARQTTGEFLQSLGIARGSLAELETFLILSTKLEMTAPENSGRLLTDCAEINKMLNALIKSLPTRHWSQVTVHGVDVCHPNTGEIRSDGADGIAGWFIDTDYNEESFFVRHAYFLGANDPYKALKTTLKAEINREAWETLHSDTSRPFEKPKSGRIAVKVINHLGDEVMKVFRV